VARGPVPARGSRVVTEPVGPRRARALVERVIGLADEPADGNDLRLLKCMGHAVAGRHVGLAQGAQASIELRHADR
jgi:hypothetical protein